MSKLEMAWPMPRAIPPTKWLLAILPALIVTPARADGDAARGEQRFKECAACHSVAQGSNNVGPSLAGLFGRAAGSLADFRYSNAMRKSGITWTPQTLDEFLADPQKRVPANRMPYAGLTDAAARADLIAYLEKATK
jgi:cytochrome c2